jgi:ubiquinone/menaquinone biosynthesis C-methylase UbiE
MEQIRRSFDEASRDEEHFPATIDPRILHVRLIQEYFGDLAGKRVLDAGCGKGRFARILQENNSSAQICGLDISPEMLKFVPEGIDRAAASMTAIPFPAAAFDFVYATESLEHAVEIERAVSELCRVLKPGGRIVIIDKNIEHFGKLETPAWEKWFDRKEVESMLRLHCRDVSSRFISYWEDVKPDGMFLAWMAQK